MADDHNMCFTASVQRLDTIGAKAIESFVIDGTLFLAVAFADDGA